MRSCFILVLVLSSVAWAEVRLVTGNGYPPFSDTNLPEGGLATLLVSEVYALLDEPVSISYLPWTRGYLLTQQASFDATFPYITSASRLQEMHFSEPLLEVSTLIISHVDNPIADMDTESLVGRHFCWALGWALPAPLQALVDSGKVSFTQVREFSSCLPMVSARRVDFLVTNNYQWPVILAGDTLSDQADFYIPPEPFQQTNLHLIAAKTELGYQQVANFNQGMQQLKDKGRWQQLIDSYFHTLGQIPLDPDGMGSQPRSPSPLMVIRWTVLPAIWPGVAQPG